MKTKILLIILCAGLFSCSKSEPMVPYGPPIYTNSYIFWFVGVEEIRVLPQIGGFEVDENAKMIRHRDELPEDTTAEISDGIALRILITGKGGAYDCAGEVQHPDDACIEFSKRYKELVEEIGDISFDRKIYVSSHLARVTLAKIKSVSITCDKDFNAEHPAGSNVNDLFTLYVNDAYALVKNNYQPMEGSYGGETDSWTENYPIAVVREKLSIVNFPERPYLDHRWTCVLDEAPQHTDTYTFYVKMVLEDGRVLEANASLTIKGLE